MGHFHKTSKYDFLDCNQSEKETETLLQTIVLRTFGQATTDRVLKALAMARMAHGAQLRANGAPYIVHPMRVAMMLAIYERSTTSDLLVAALLHDTLEDTSLTADEVEQAFGRAVRSLVEPVSRRHGPESLAEKQTAKRQKWEQTIAAIQPIRALKTFDNLDNMICWKTIPEDNPAREKIPRWVTEAREMSLPLAHMTNKRAYKMMQEQYTYYVSHGYANQPITA